MKWLVTGGTGQLGSDVVDLLRTQRPTDTVAAPGRDQMDLAQSASIRASIQDVRPDVVINCAAWTDVDGAEENEAIARVVNADGPAVLAEALAEQGHGLLVQISTDFVFDGESPGPLTESAPLSPRSAYGRTKAWAEEVVRGTLPERSLVVRTAWLHGSQRHDFVGTILGRLERGEPVSVVDDQWGHPSWSRDVAGRINLLVQSRQEEKLPPCVYHAVNCEVTSRWGLAREIADITGFQDASIARASSDSLPNPASRPARVELLDAASAELGLPAMRSWSEALRAALSTVAL